MEKYDVLIVGAGPAGSAAARELKGGSFKILMVEKAKLPREKMCSGLVIPAAQKILSEHFGSIPETCFSLPKALKTVKRFHPGGPVTDVPQEAYSVGEFTRILNVRRSSFDNWLANESGADIRSGCKFVGFTREKDELVVMLRSGKKEFAVRTRYLIGADGGRAAVRRSVVPNFRRQERLLIAYEERWAGVVDLDPKYFYHFNDKAFSEGLFAAFSIKDGLLISVSCGTFGSNPIKLHNNFVDYLKKRHGFRPSKLVHSRGCLLNYRGAGNGLFDFGRDNVLLTGEAGGFMRAFGEGITPALITGRAAAQAVIKSLESGIEAGSAYTELVQEEVEVIKAQHEEVRRLGGGYNET